MVWPVKKMDSIQIPRWALEFKFEGKIPMGCPKTKQLPGTRRQQEERVSC
jgi:hypothetical protein